MNTSVPSPRPRRAVRAACFVGCVAVAAAVLGYVHDRQWNGYDDGMYIHVADRLARGAVQNRDVQDMHFGYINFANALSLKLFGDDAVSLRYPLVLMGVANAALAFLLLARAGTAVATAGSLAVTATSYPQFMNPAAHWYVLFLALLTAGAITWLPRPSATRPVVIGLLVGLIVLFRQLSGAFVAAGVLVWLLLELPRHGRGIQTLLGKSVVAVLGLGLAAYLAKKTDAVAFVMYGLWPLAILLYCVVYLSAGNRDVFTMLARFTLGAALAAAPLLAYHVHHGSVRVWLNDTVFAAYSITRLDFIDDLKYWMTMVGGARSVLRPAGVTRWLAGLFWAVAPALPAVLGAAVVWRLWRSRAGDRTGPHGEGGSPAALALPIIATFYFLVTLHYQKWIYFFFGVPFTFLGLLALAPATGAGSTVPGLFRRALPAGVAALSAVAFFVVCGTFADLLAGRSSAMIKDHGVPRCSIYLDRERADLYRKIHDLAAREVAPDEPILALPVQPELYYITNRRNPTRFYNTAIALHSDDDVASLVRSLEPAPPKLVFFNPSNHYVTAECRRLMDWVRHNYDALEPMGAYEVYRRRDGAPRAAGAARSEGPHPSPCVTSPSGENRAGGTAFASRNPNPGLNPQ